MPGMHGVPDPHDPPAQEAEVPDVPEDEHLDLGRIEEDLETAPEDKPNATDGYAPGDSED